MLLAEQGADSEGSFGSTDAGDLDAQELGGHLRRNVTGRRKQKAKELLETETRGV